MPITAKAAGDIAKMLEAKK